MPFNFETRVPDTAASVLPFAMAKPGWNDPCAFGSGKKYKKCCLEKERGPEAGALPEFVDAGATESTLLWIYENFPGEIAARIVEAYCQGLTLQELEELRRLPDEVRRLFFENAHEWILAEGLASDGRRFLDLALAPGGPALTASGRLFLEAMGSTRLDLYEVVESIPGESLTLLSKTDPEAEPIRVLERSGSRSLRKGDFSVPECSLSSPRS
jgi:hypothetical protein